MSKPFKTDSRVRGMRPFLVSGLFCAASIAMVIVSVYFLFETATFQAERWLQDRIMESPLARKTPVNDHFVLLGVDEPSRALDVVSEEEINASAALTLMLEGFPWPRGVYAEALDRLIGEGGARLVVIDLLFLDETERDAELKEALDRHADKVVIGSKFDAPMADHGGMAMWRRSIPADSVIPQAELPDSRIGYVNFWQEPDGRVRTIDLEITQEALNGEPPAEYSIWDQALTMAALRKLGRAEGIETRKGPRAFRFTKMDRETYKPLSIYQIFVERMWRLNYGEKGFFKDKIVFIGPAATDFQDFHAGPFGEMLGAQLHMNALAAALAGEFYARTPVAIDIVLIGVMGVLAWLIVQFVKGPLVRTFLLLGVAVTYLLVAVTLFNHAKVLITCMAPLAAFGSSGALCFAYDFARRVVEELRVRRALERYVSKDLAHEILENREDFFSALGGTDKAVTMLFSDIRGFTSMTEEMGGKDLVPQLNEYLGEMVEAVFRNHGTLDKFIGDAVMAVWGSVRSEGPKADTLRAVRAAVEMSERLARLNARWQEAGKRPFQIGIGLNHGTAIFGNIGSVERMDPTVIGDAVNLAARLEGLTKEYRCEIIVSASVADLVRDEFALRPVDKVRVKGKTAAVEIFAVVGSAGGKGAVPSWLPSYEEGVRAFRARDFSGAAARFREALEACPDDYLSRMYLENAEHFMAEPPDEGWDGVTTMKTK